MSIATLIEDAEKAQGAWIGRIGLVLLDGDVRCHLRCEGERFICDTRDDCGRGMLVSASTKVDAVTRSIDGYLDILNHGI